MLKRLKAILVISFIILLASQSYAQEEAAVAQEEALSVPQVEDYIVYLQAEWARINYQVINKDTKQHDIKELETYAEGVTAAFPDRAEPKIWEAIILSTDAGITKSISGLPKLKKAKKLLEISLEQNPQALNSSAYTSLGSLYYQVPGWPISFGDKDKAEKLLSLAVRQHPQDIDANYFYGDYLFEVNKYEEAIQAFERALAAPDRPNRPVADAGRRKEVREGIAKAEKKLGRKPQQRLNN